jgi:hypothetical protein
VAGPSVGGAASTVRHHRRPSRTVRAIGVVVLVAGAIAGAYLGVGQFQARNDDGGVALSVDEAGVVAPAADPARQKALDRRLALLAHSYDLSCAESAATKRRFNWNNRGSGVVQWFLQQFRTGAPAPAAAARTPAR